MPNYWKDETSGQMAKAVEAYWDHSRRDELSPENIASLKLYLIHWAEAPCYSRLLGGKLPTQNATYRNSEYATALDLFQLDKAIAIAHNINNTEDISIAVNLLMQLGIDPF
jgi:hypothetical protein